MKNVLIVLAVSLIALVVAAEETTTPATPSNATEASTTTSATTPTQVTTKEETKVTCADSKGECPKEDQKPSASSETQTTPKQD